MSNQVYGNERPESNYWLPSKGCDQIYTNKLTGPPLAILDKGVIYELTDGKLYYNGNEIALHGDINALDVTYTPTTPGDWSVVPTDVQEALDELASTGAGDVVGPASSVTNGIATYSDTTGKLIKDSGLTIEADQTIKDGAIQLIGYDGTGFNTVIASGYDKTEGTQNTIVGANAANNLVAVATGNTFVGNNSAQNKTSGSFNTCVGQAAGLNAPVAGNYMCAIGSQAGNCVGGGDYIISIADKTARGAVSNAIYIGDSSYNTCNIAGISGVTPAGTSQMVLVDGSDQLGSQAIPFKVGANTILDDAASLYPAVTTAVNNVFVGTNPSSLSSGNDNTAVGDDCLTSVSTGSFNTAFGSGPLRAVTTSTGNTAVGLNAGAAITAGSNNNVLLGTQAAQICPSLTNCTLVGTNAMQSQNVSMSNNIAIGNSAGSSAPNTSSNLIYIGNGGNAGDTTNVTRIGSTQTSAYMAGIYNYDTQAVAANYMQTVDSTGRMGRQGIPIIYTHQSYDITLINTVASYYYCPVGNSAPQSSITTVAVRPIEAMTLYKLNFWVQTGASWVSSGTGITIQVVRGGSLVGSTITLTPTAINQYTSSEVVSTAASFAVTDRLSAYITQTSTTMDVIAYGFSIEFVKA